MGVLEKASQAKTVLYILINAINVIMYFSFFEVGWRTSTNQKKTDIGKSGQQDISKLE